MPGHHNVLNSLAAIAVADELEVPLDVARSRRSRPSTASRVASPIVGTRSGGVTLVDDYGHHPAEVEATLDAARRAYTGRVVVAFQPHRYTRTQRLFDDFTRAFNDADVVVRDRRLRGRRSADPRHHGRAARAGDRRARPSRRAATSPTRRRSPSGSRDGARPATSSSRSAPATSTRSLPSVADANARSGRQGSRPVRVPRPSLHGSRGERAPPRTSTSRRQPDSRRRRHEQAPRRTNRARRAGRERPGLRREARDRTASARRARDRRRQRRPPSPGASTATR